MLKPVQLRFLTSLLAGVVVMVACGEGTEGTESPLGPVTTSDSGISGVDAGPSAPGTGGAGLPGTGGMASPGTGGTGAAGGGGMGLPGGSARQDAGSTSRVDASQPGRPPTDAGAAQSSDAGSPGSTGGAGSGMCCADGNCLCHGDAPTSLTSARGPYMTQSYTVSAGCVYYPTNAEPPFAAVAVSDGLLGSGGCGSFQTGQWGPLYASWGIVAMIVNTGSSDQPSQRGTALTRGIAAFKTENTRSGSPLNGKLAGRYGTSGFSMGGGGTSFSAADDATLKTNVMIMAYGPTREAVTVPTLVICGSSDFTASCSSHGTPFYGRVAESVPKMRVTVSSGHNGQPSAGSSRSGQYGLAFQKVFLEGDTRWRSLLVGAMSDATTIK